MMCGYLSSKNNHSEVIESRDYLPPASFSVSVQPGLDAVCLTTAACLVLSLNVNDNVEWKSETNDELFRLFTAW